MDFDWVELVAMRSMGHTKKEARHMYLGEFIDKFRLYKKLFNLEKQGMYALEMEQPQKVASLRDL